jgi:MFS family permease
MTQFHLLRENRFSHLFWTQFFGAFNDNFFKNALVMLVTFESVNVMGLPPAQIVALAGGVFILPFLLFSALAGQIADKFEKGKIIRWIKLAEIGIMTLAAIGFLKQWHGFLLVALFFMGLHSTFFGPIKYSILPQHLRLEELVNGNALVEAGTFVAILLGTITGGTLIGYPGGVGIVSGGLIVVALIGYLTCLRIPAAAAASPTMSLSFRPVRPTLDLFRFARQPASVFAAILAISWFWFFGAVMLSVFPPLVKDVLRGNEHLVTVFLAEFSVGIACGSMLTSKLSKGKLNMSFMFKGGIGLTAFSLWFAWLCNGESSFATLGDFFGSMRGLLIFASLFLLSTSGGLFIVPLYTLMQERSDPTQRSRVIAANNIMNALFMVAASLMLIGLLRAHVTVPQAVGITGFLNLLTVALVRRPLKKSV